MDQEIEKRIICPNCGIEMSPVKTDSHYGAVVVLDQCPECGGIWFDEFEMYQVKQSKAKEIENKLDEGKLKKPASVKSGSLHCPKDGSLLQQFKDINFPESIIVESCPQCGGFWFNRGEFTQFQQARSERLKKIKEKDQDSDLSKVNAMLKMQSYDPVDTMGRLGRFLSQPVYGTSSLDMTTDTSLPTGKVEEWTKIIWTVANLLLRILVFRR